MPTLAILSTFFAILKPLTDTKRLLNYFCLVEKVLSFDLVGHMWKLVKNWLQKCIFYLGEIFCISWNCLLATSLSKVKNVTKQQCSQHHFYCLQQSWGKVMFSEACVKNSVHSGGGGGIPACLAGHMNNQQYISSCTVGGSQLVRRQHTGNIKCMMG